ncbi:hypothetical protein A2V54_00175 [candidate division WWE3 bacterium RBG_19FT_COMBO_53_11]|uniref:Sulfotransferase domain-containing protein n=1 Tax=candidate division WWE3 bacterium RBG_19FT_COMBO_53_11 TaxID=1802613 RepID=A0A1F4UIV3_UNCKA|nr:MAG: hypothetical protein A2V54_00175 [candidate division WWE3 bacterium RBG_19FT_COMBO_53_11]
MVTVVNPDLIKKIRIEELPPRKPNLFIVGAAKSGTTALHIFLDQHPDVFMSKPKELRFFCKDIHQEFDDFYRTNKRFFKKYNFYPCRTEKEYLSFFKDWKNEKIAGESSPQYLYSKVAAQEIQKFNPDAKIIIMLRNPVNWIFSNYLQALRSGDETVRNFEKALSLEEERTKGKQLDKFSLLAQPSSLFYFEWARFAEQVKRYLDVFNRRQIKIIIYEEFKKDNAKVYREILEFLGVDQNFVPEFKPVYVTKKVAFPRLLILWRSLLFTKMSYFPLSALNRFIGGKFFGKERKIPSMDLSLKMELMKKFKPEVERLGKLVGRDLISLWKYDTNE